MTDNLQGQGDHCVNKVDGPDRMNIGDAKSVFHSYGGSLRSDFESLATLFRDKGIGDAVSNSNYLHALSLTDLMFRHADWQFCMLTGGAGDGFLSCLEAPFRAMLAKIRRNSGVARIIVVGGPESSLLKQLAVDYPGTLQVMPVRGMLRIPHFIVCDDDMVRDEDVHEPLTDVSSANLVKARVYFRNKSKAGAFLGRFDAMWNVLTGSTRAK